MKIINAFFIGLFCVIVGLPHVALAELEVVTTLPGLAAIVKDIGGEHVSVTALVPSTVDPHYLDPRPSLLLALHDADALIVNGMELEVGWLPRLLTNARNNKINPGGAGYLDVSSSVRPLEVPTNTDRSQGDVHAQGNPHFLYDPRQGALVAVAITRRLIAIDSTHAEDYRRNGAAFIEAAKALAREERARFEALPEAQRRVISYHRSLAYLASWLKLKRVANIEPKPGIPPNPGHIAKVLRMMKGGDVGVILQEVYYPREAGEKLAKLGGAKFVVIPAAPNIAEGETYLQFLRRVARMIYEAVDA